MHTEPSPHRRTEAPSAAPSESYVRLFLRFLKFGCLAWGGPVAQIDMIRKELVDEEQWVTREHFNRVFAVYQVLPGPEAHELCVYFGMLRRGRLGGLLAGLGFMLPGFVLMFALSWFYLMYGLNTSLEAVFRGVQAGVIALIVRAGHRIAQHALTDWWLVSAAGLSAVASLLSAHFTIPLVVGGVGYALARRGWRVSALALGLTVLAGIAIYASLHGIGDSMTGAVVARGTASGATSVPLLFWSGLRAGLLTFGGAYTVIPFLQQDAVGSQGWMTNAEFLDGLALSGILPAPLIIFSTFVGFVAAGALGALAMTVGIFLPAFGFTLVAHNVLERIVQHPTLRLFLHGVTAAVVGLITATTLLLARSAITNLGAFVVFAGALAVLYRWPPKIAVPIAILGSAIAGLLLFR